MSSHFAVFAALHKEVATGLVPFCPAKHSHAYEGRAAVRLGADSSTAPGACFHGLGKRDGRFAGWRELVPA